MRKLVPEIKAKQGRREERRRKKLFQLKSLAQPLPIIWSFFSTPFGRFLAELQLREKKESRGRSVSICPEKKIRCHNSLPFFYLDRIVAKLKMEITMHSRNEFRWSSHIFQLILGGKILGERWRHLNFLWGTT